MKNSEILEATAFEVEVEVDTVADIAETAAVAAELETPWGSIFFGRYFFSIQQALPFSTQV